MGEDHVIHLLSVYSDIYAAAIASSVHTMLSHRRAHIRNSTGCPCVSRYPMYLDAYACTLLSIAHGSQIELISADNILPRNTHMKELRTMAIAFDSVYKRTPQRTR